ncbi:MAG: hypothetical protein A2901_01530 [Elusimicrobia bacterium RIFCSPLOWO2_01_FULL_54_10]|nr:MAG: hypothetical protein A2901_01530 [Elusimicrobia bacterium RIFCSPLOWO2_01_FULL_54_10]
MKRSIINRFQKIFVLPLIVLLVCFVIGLSWWTLQLYLGIEKADRIRAGQNMVETLSKSGSTPFLNRDAESLKNLSNLVREKDKGVIATAFLNFKGQKAYQDGEEFDLPLDPDRLKFLNATETHEGAYRNLYLAPVMGRQSRSIGIAAVQISNEDFNMLRRRVRMILAAIALLVVVFNVFIYHYLVREALRASQLERAYNDLTKLQDQILLQEKMAAIGRLASGVGHELRNPLGAIKNAVYYIKDAIPASNLVEKDPSIPEFIEVIESEIKSATAIISDLLDYSKVGKLHPHMTDINGLLAEVKSVLDTPPGVTWTESFARGLPQVLADPLRLRQVFINLATNACQAMPEGGSLTITTELEIGEQGKAVQIVFKDTGSGIPEENINKIFEPLFTTKDKGTGLGLAICTGIVEAHGGKIEVRSAVGKGSEFIVILPLEAKRVF